MDAGNEPADLYGLNQQQTDRLKGWTRHMTLVNTLGVSGALIIALAFLIFGHGAAASQGAFA